MSNRYAKNTEVSVEQSQKEIEALLKKYGASKFAINFETDEILFEIHQVAGKVSVKKPNIDDKDIQKTKSGRLRNKYEIEKMLEQKNKQRWRVMLLLLKASLEAVECGVMSVKEALLPHLLLKNGQRVTDAYNNLLSSKIVSLKEDE